MSYFDMNQLPPVCQRVMQYLSQFPSLLHKAQGTDKALLTHLHQYGRDHLFSSLHIQPSLHHHLLSGNAGGCGLYWYSFCADSPFVEQEIPKMLLPTHWESFQVWLREPTFYSFGIPKHIVHFGFIKPVESIGPLHFVDSESEVDFNSDSDSGLESRQPSVFVFSHVKPKAIQPKPDMDRAPLVETSMASSVTSVTCDDLICCRSF